MPEDTVSVEDKRKQSFGLTFDRNIMKIFKIKQSIFKNVIETDRKSYQGSIYNGSLNLKTGSNSLLMDNTFSYELDNTFLEKKDTYNTDLRLSYYRDYNTIDLNLKLLDSNQDVYTYQEKTDNQDHQEYYDNIILQKRFYDYVLWNFKQSGDFRRSIFDVEKEKNNWTFDNYIDSYFKYEQKSYSIKTGMKHNFKKRYLKIDDQNRKTIERGLYGVTQFYSSFVDTLSFDMSVFLSQNYHSYPYNSLDNDRQIQLFRIYLQDKINHFINVNSLFSMQRSHEIYINSSLSSNNNRKTTYIIQPELISVLNPNLQIFNKYNIRATYENYIWNDYLNDRFYRRITGEWGINILDSEDENDRLQLSYSYDSNETADYQSSDWYMTSGNIIRTISVKLKMSSDKLTYRIEPQLKYEYQNYESEVLMDMNWNFLPDSHLRIAINPIGDTFNKLIWKVSANLEFVY
jgi:hypothetical protein